MPSTNTDHQREFGSDTARWTSLTARVLAIVLAVASSFDVVAVLPAQASDTATRWDSISESSGCGDPYTRGPFASKKGSLSDSEAVLGPFGTYFGRSISELRSHLVFWTVPYSGGQRVQVHEAMLPSLNEVKAGLDAQAREGRLYFVRSVASFVPRTIGGRYQISRHAMGLALDINPAQNPYRGDDVLVTDMPGWFVQTWVDAGFCWGGDWLGVKDPMHFSWMGPRSTPAEDDRLEPLPPHTAKAPFAGVVANHGTQFGPVISRYVMDVADATGNGTSDVAGLRSHPNGAVIDIAYSTFGFGFCSIRRWFVPNETISAADHVVFADVDGDNGQDLIALIASDGGLEALTATRGSRFEDVSTSATGLASGASAVTGADFDGDHRADLWETTSDGLLQVWGGPNFDVLLHASPLPGGAPSLIAAGDRDGGDLPELFALYENGAGSRIDVLKGAEPWTVETSVALDHPYGSIEAIGAGDYDGDGRADLQVLANDGDLVVYLGNSPTGIPPSRWFVDPDAECQQPILLVYDGSFMDDDSSIFEDDIESIAGVGVTKGCNPPFNDWFCPEDPVSREQMAAFLVRALDLSESSHRGFSDVPADSTFVDDIAILATAGITKGCNPPANDEFCPKDPVTREQMAAFLVRALKLSDATHRGFTDVPQDSTFVGDITKLAAAGITRGCNPPDNTSFCPHDTVTRGQMAAFLHRAGLGT